ncbi:MAG TPA: tripartite tricarboxylate transporter substrate binding protein [Burkholderiales bacterium]|nr:tripartite tricarboxylate transporter substrate binding protein [Burkholderiales bacterium]
MKRIVLIFSALAGAWSGSAVHAADPYPTRPVRLIVAYAPGGNADIQGRYLAERLTEALGKQVVVDNRPGANGVIGMELTARSPADGYTLLLVSQGFTVNPAMYPKLSYDTLKDFQPISLIGDTPLLFVANNSVAAGNVKEAIALARSRPGQLNFGSSGNGSPAHLAGALLELMTGVKLVHVPYKATAGALVDVVSGQVQLGFPSLTSSLAQVKAGKLKAFAITVKTRSQLAPDIPTMSEAGVPGYEASIWNGILTPAGTPRPIVNRLNQAIVKLLNSREARERYANVGAEIRYSTPEEFQAFVRTEIAKWAKVVKAAGIMMEQ